MPSIIRNTSGGTSVGGGALAPRSRRASTAQVDGYWRGGGAAPLEVQYLVLGGGGGGGGYQSGVSYGHGGNSGQWKSSTIGENSGSCSLAESVFAPVLGTNYSVTRGGGGAGASAGANSGSSGSSSSFSTVSSSGGSGGASTLGYTGGSSAGGGISCGNTTNIRGSVETYGIGGGTDGAGSPASGGANTGNGGQGGGGFGQPGGQPGGSGGSGIVILKYPDAYTITIGGGLTGSTAGPSNGFKVTTITAGTGNVSWA